MFKNEILWFVLKAFFIFILWYLIYELWILPNEWIDKPLSKNIAAISAGVLSMFGYEVELFDRVVSILGAPGIEIVNGCNGISAIGLFIGFIVAFPGKDNIKVPFMILGVMLIYLVNIVRIIVLAITQAQYPKAFEVTHDYSTTTIFYFVIFALWVLWVNISTENASVKKSN